MDFSPEKLRARFKELTAKHDSIQQDLQPLRDALDATVADGDLTQKAARAKEAKIRPQIVALQQKLSPIESERAAIARALGGKTGE